MGDRQRAFRAFMDYFLNAEQARYIARLKTGQLETFDLSWPCLTTNPPYATDEDQAVHREVTAIFKRMGVR